MAVFVEKPKGHPPIFEKRHLWYCMRGQEMLLRCETPEAFGWQGGFLRLWIPSRWRLQGKKERQQKVSEGTPVWASSTPRR